MTVGEVNAHKYRPDIDGLRALAVLPVLLFHADLGCPGGYVGVDVFFVISGYLISSLILKDLDKGVFSLREFWERRIRRIVPALTVVVFATVIAGWFLFLPEDLAMLGKSVRAQAALLSNVFFYEQDISGRGYFAPSPYPKPLLHTWSLAVEEQFYLGYPVLLILLARYGRATVIKVIGVLSVTSFALSVYGSYSHRAAAFYLLHFRACELALGALLAMTRGRFAAGEKVRETSGWAGVGLIGYALLFYKAGSRFPGLAAVPPCLGAALIIFSSESKLSRVGRILALKPIVFIGLISYSLYLWHWPLLVFSKYGSYQPQSVAFRTCVLALSVVLATLTWKYVETPFRRKWILKKGPQIFGLAGVSTATLILIGFALFRYQGFPSRLPERAVRFAESRNHSSFLNEISLERALAGDFPELGSQSKSQPIKLLLWGDSHAMAVTPIFDELCRRFSWRGVQATHSATTPVFGFNTTDRAHDREQSFRFDNAVLAFIKTNHVENVVLTGTWLSYSKTHAFEARLFALIRAIMRTGARIYILKDVPHPSEGFDVPRIAAICAMHHGDVDQLGINRERYLAENRELNKTLERVSRMGVTVLDPTDYFVNDKGLLGVVKNDQVLFRDYNHLTVEGSRMLAPLFERTVFKAN